jgi:uncharacterized membrane protein required for colicin V production
LPELFKEMNWLDILFIILFLIIIYDGIRKGMSGQVLPLIGWIAMLFVGVTFYVPLSKAIFGEKLQKWSLPVSFLIATGGVFIVTRFLSRAMNFKKEGEVSPVERISGAGISMLRAALLFGVISMFLLLVPIEEVRSSVTEFSKTAMFFVDTDAEIYSWMTGYLEAAPKRNKESVVQEFLSPYEKRKDRA